MDGEDREGFSAGSAQFDSDITAERHPRCALGLNATELLEVCCDGRRSGVDGGLDLSELARLLISFGAEQAINPRRRGLGHAGPPRPSAQPAVFAARPARPGVQARRDGAVVRARPALDGQDAVDGEDDPAGDERGGQQAGRPAQDPAPGALRGPPCR
jgi:hypothetical protein